MNAKYEVSTHYINGLHEQTYFNKKQDAVNAVRKLASLYSVSCVFLWDQLTNTIISSTLDGMAESKCKQCEQTECCCFDIYESMHPNQFGS